MHDDDSLQNTIDKLSGCKYVFVSQIHSVAEITLSKRNVTEFTITDYILDAIESLLGTRMVKLLVNKYFLIN